MAKKRIYLGELLIEEKLITQEQLSRALDIQKKRGGLVGMILVNQGFLSEEALTRYTKIQSERNAALGHTEENKPKRARLGELLLANGEITPKQLNEALEFQKKNNVKLGIALLQMEFIDKTTLIRYLTKQAQTVIDSIGISTVEAKHMVSEVEKK